MAESPAARPLISDPVSSPGAPCRFAWRLIDTVIGRETDGARLVVAVCRRTRFTMIGYLKQVLNRVSLPAPPTLAETDREEHQWLNP